MIRRAGPEDIPAIVNMGRDFHAYSPWSAVPFDDEATEDFAAKMIDGGVILMSDTGMIGGVLSPLYFNPAHVVAVELFWWATAGGGALREAFEEWAKDGGAHAVQFSALGNTHSEAMGRMFARHGYRPVETGYLKDL